MSDRKEGIRPRVVRTMEMETMSMHFHTLMAARPGLVPTARRHGQESGLARLLIAIAMIGVFVICLEQAARSPNEVQIGSLHGKQGAQL